MKFSYNWLQELIREQLPKPKELADLLSLHSFEVEGLDNERRAIKEVIENISDYNLIAGAVYVDNGLSGNL